MNLHDILPWIAGVAFLVFAFLVAFRKSNAPKSIWLLPASLSAVFMAFSLYAVVTEGPVGFWIEHVRNA